MGIRESLVLDHFYIALPESEFKALLPITECLSSCIHSKNQSDTENWEGIYIYSRTGAYFEIVKADNLKMLGLVFSAPRPQYLDVRKIKGELPQFEWRLETVNWPDHTPWFDMLSTGKEKNWENVFFNPWIMHYHFNHRDHHIGKLGVKSIDRFVALSLEVGKNRVEEIVAEMAWNPDLVTMREDQVVIAMIDRDGSEFKIDIKIIEGNSGIEFKGIEFRKNQDSKITDKDMDEFRLMDSFLLKKS